MINFLELNAYALLLCIAIMTLVWWRQLYTQNAGIVDAWWAMSFGIITIFYFAMTPFRDILSYVILITVVLWSFRLGLYLLVRNKNHEKEDIRYQKLRCEYGKQARFKMWRFFIYQAISNVLLAFPFLLIFLNERINTGWIWLGLSIWLIGIVGESTADAQLKRFRSLQNNLSKVCETGLWNYSRHPNYFFEWLIWVSYFLMALSVEWGWTAILCPVLMYFLLTKVTGIPMLEELALKSKGLAYLDYQKRTSAFFPWFKKA